jgi:hypothetical protein
MSKSLKSNTLNITNVLSTSGSLNLADGYQFMDNSYDTNNGLPPNFQFGTSETQGNSTRNNFNVNSNGPILFGETSDDKLATINKFPLILKQFPIAATFPWIYPTTTNWTQVTQTILDSSSTEVPVGKCLGKGNGNIEIFKCGNTFLGDPSKAGSSKIATNGETFTTVPQSRFVDNLLYPYNGEIYAGTLVEIVSQFNTTTNQKETVAVPYQSGRGVSGYYTSFQPQDQPQVGQSLPWGPVEWPSGGAISPLVSPGVEPQNQSSVYGIVLDSYSSQSYSDRPFKSVKPISVTDDREPWYNHPAPHTIPPTSFKGVVNGDKHTTQGFLSPGPNDSNVFWSPWPKQYAYKGGDPLPVLTKGITTARIGASYNIALGSYGISSYISATDKSWIPVGIIPLFQGERLEAGSLVYGAVKGTIQTPGPLVVNPATNDPDKLDSLGEGIIGQNIWDLSVDSTWGNIGWCGTPGLSFHNIPDGGVSCIETLAGGVIPYLVQAAQGSIIVQGVTSISPYPGLGNLYDPKLENGGDIYTEREIYEIQKKRFQLEGVSGRGVLSQMAPEKAQPVGVLMETITGTGRWPYDGLPVVAPEDNEIISTTGGVSYTIAPGPTVPTRTDGAGDGTITTTWTSYNASEPYYGQITQTLVASTAGSGYITGDTVTVKDNSLLYYGSPQYKGNNAAFIYNRLGVGANLLPAKGGSRYNLGPISRKKAFNMSLNSVYFSFEGDGSGSLSYSNVNPSPAIYPQGFDRYKIGILTLRVISNDIPYQDSAIFDVTVFPSNVKVVEFPSFAGIGYPNTGGPRFFETEVISYSSRAPVLSYDIYEPQGKVIDLEYVDYGVGNATDDILLLVDDIRYGDFDPLFSCGENASVKFGKIPEGYQSVSSSAPWYYSDNTTQYDTIQISGTGAPALTVVVIPDTSRLEKSGTGINYEYIPVFCYPTVPIATSASYIYKLQFSDNLPGGATQIAEPWYIGNSFSLYTVNGSLLPMVGGSNYITSNSIETYNMTANTLRVPLTIVNGFITNVNFTTTQTDPRYFYNRNRYTVGTDIGTEFRIMSNVLEESDQAVFKFVQAIGDTSMSFELVKSGLDYQLADGIWYFQTQRTDQTSCIVNIEADDKFLISANKGQLTKVKLQTPGTGNEQEDILLVLQGDKNGFFLYNDNMEYVNLPPYARLSGYLVDTSESAWDKYSSVMQSVTNLLDMEVLIEVRPNQGQYMENILPSGQQFSSKMPSNENPYRSFY